MRVRYKDRFLFYCEDYDISLLEQTSGVWWYYCLIDCGINDFVQLILDCGCYGMELEIFDK